MNTKSNHTSLNITEDKYNGITIDGSNLPDNINTFEKELLKILYKNKLRNLLWIKIPIYKSNFIPLLTTHDFVFHHCNEEDITLLKRISTNPIIPTAKNHTLGVGAVVISDNKLLVIKDKFQKGFKLPGGHIDDRENITTALKREVLEETGIKIEFKNIISLGHFSPSQFRESNLYIVCTAKALSCEINIQDADEILESKWLNLDDFFLDEEILSYNKALVKSAIENKGLKKDECNFFTNPNKTYEFFF
ncbi:MAG TPA: NUDIX domain-containing protein [Arcobacter sp.]|nr:NUDIX domain-containing protein [Arcobacter sp.]